MSDLNFLLRRINQKASSLEANRLEEAATTTLVVLLALIALTAWLYVPLPTLPGSGGRTEFTT